MLQIIDHFGMGEPEIGAAVLLGNAWMQLREAFDMQLVDHRIAPGRRRRTVALPIEYGIDDTTLVVVGGAVLRIGLLSRCLRRRDRCIRTHASEQRIFPGEGAPERSCIGIEQQFGGVVPQSVLRIERTVSAISIVQTRAAVRRGQKAVPYVLGALGQGEARDLMNA